MEHHNRSPESPRPNRRQFLLTTGSALAAGVIAHSGRLINEFTSPPQYNWLLQEGIDSFAGDLSEQEKKLVWATQCVPAPDLFEAKVEGTAWKSKPAGRSPPKTTALYSLTVSASSLSTWAPRRPRSRAATW